MDPRQMRRRCPSYRFVSIAKLEDHELAFSRRSTRRRCGVADVAPSSGNEVWGVLYHIRTRRDVLALDKAEGFKVGRKRINAYDRERRQVWSPLFPNRTTSVQLYIARPHKTPPLPGKLYVMQLMFGAEYWSLPKNYQIELQNISTSKEMVR
jgi:hypothetical protein